MTEIMLDEMNIKRCNLFFKTYELESFASTYERRFLGNKIKKICRFCGQTTPNVKFSDTAHVIPEMLGNKKLFSYFECNTCNKEFSKYESSLAAFLGPIRTFFQIKGKTGTPTFAENDKRVTIVSKDNKYEINTYDNDSIKIIEEENRFKLTTYRQSYIPINVLKIFLKMGLCLLEEKYLSKYKKCFEFILNKDLMFAENEGENSMASLFYYFIPIPNIFNFPSISIYKKIDKNLLMPYHVCIITFNYYIIQFFFSENDLDNDLFGKKITFPIFPLLVDIRYFINQQIKIPNVQIENLNKIEKFKKAPIEIIFKYGNFKQDSNLNSNNIETLY